MSHQVFISQSDIQQRVKVLADKINADFQGKELVVICVLNGAFMFCADLVREINLPVVMEFIKASSYGSGTVSSGKITLDLGFQGELKNKHILVVEDIVDTGLTLTKLFEMIKHESPASLKLASLLFKPARNKHKVPIDYLGFEIEDHFVIGYGLDYDGKFRELPYIGIYQGEVNE